MPKYISESLALAIHEDLIRSYGGSAGLHDEGRQEAVLASPQASFSGQELYPTPAAKAAATWSVRPVGTHSWTVTNVPPSPWPTPSCARTVGG